MDMVYMNGGLGNQVFQYIFARYIEETTGERVLIDDMHYFLLENEIKHNITNTPANTQDKYTHNGYEIEYVFPNVTKPLLLSEYFDKDVWDYMKEETKKSPLQRLGVVRQLLENGLDLSVLAEAVDMNELDGLTCPIYRSAGNCYNSAITSLPGDIYYYGYWINPGWFNRYRDVFLKEFAFKPITDEKNKQYENDIKNTLSVGVHIRRGDFVRLGWTVKDEYYHSAVTQLNKINKDIVFFVFSDDLEWCKENKTQLGFRKKNTVFVEGNYDYKNNYIDMQLMSMCDILIEGASSFSYLASLLNQNPDFQAIQIRTPPMDDLAGDIKRIF
jgi:hypothetical protein